MIALPLVRLVAKLRGIPLGLVLSGEMWLLLFLLVVWRWG